VLAVGSYKAITVPTFKNKDNILNSLSELKITLLCFVSIILSAKVNAPYSNTLI